MSAMDKLQTLQNVLNFIQKVIVIADKVIDYVINNVQTKGV